MKNKITNKIIFVLTLIALMIISMIAVSATNIADIADMGEWPHLKVSLINQDPDPVEPGSYVEIRWMVENLGSLSAKNVEFEIIPQYPFTLLPGTSALKDIGSLEGAQMGDNKVVLYYKFKVDEDAVEGTSHLKLRYKIDDGSWVNLDETDILVSTVDAALMVTSVKTDPKVVAPGEEFEISIKLKNMADSVMEDIDLELDLFYSTIDRLAAITTADAYYEALPFAPIQSSSKRHVQSLKPNQETILTYKLMAYPNAESRVYKVPVSLSYYDEEDTAYSKEEIIGVVVGAEPELIIDFDSSTLQQANTAGTISIKFINKGVSNIKFLYVKIPDNAQFDVTSSNSDYIGNIDSDDYESTDFSVFLNSLNENNEVTVPLEISFKDANNKGYELEKEITFKIHPPDKTGEQKSRSAMIITFVIIIIIIVYLIYRSWRKKQKRKKLEKDN
ncbi:hypothetical protein HOK51_06540 [Candidatus Woesearchaeota archaeon]|jgi:hypothetical protein|nr:hypothetical protein [Candidatus Woesearchaeota archaeon]MBT6519482.1 hypothetical protein [Candidatus Woesearchaeota archaeon]MBT7368230.1 hypothetical protein [Candidatus Woesearchaeota archaeon]